MKTQPIYVIRISSQLHVSTKYMLIWIKYIACVGMYCILFHLLYIHFTMHRNRFLFK